jgi:hypothetical protein
VEKLKVNGNEYHQWFDSFEELIAELPKLSERQPANIATLRSGMDDTSERWLGHSKGPVAHMGLIRDGWPEYADAVRAAARVIEAGLDLSTVTAMTMDVRRRKRMRRDSGDTLHMTRVWSGDLEHAWDKPERTPRRSPSQRYATVYIDLVAASYRKAGEGIWRAACAAKLNDLFTSAGISTEVWVGDSVAHAYPDATAFARHTWVAVKAKDFMQPLNEDRLAALSSVGTLRTLGFMQLAAAPYRISSGFGMPSNRGLPLPLRERQERGERVIRIGECWSMHEAQREIDAVARSLANKEVEDVA